MDGPGHGIGDRAGWRTWLPATALVGITLVFYHGLWLPGLVLFRRDAFRFFLPIKQYMVERLTAGELPQWFPYDAMGRPFIGATVTGVFHPFTALYFLFPVPDAYRASTLLSCLLAALGAFALGRTLNLSRAGSLLAGVSFALSGYVVSLTDNLLYLYSICVLPLFCATFERALKNGGAWTVAPAVIWATVFLNGDVQTGYYFGFIALLWTLARAPASYREASLRLALTGGLTVLLASVQLGPATVVFTDSDRTQPEVFHQDAVYWSTHPLRLVTIGVSPLAKNADPVMMGRFFFGSPRYGMWADSLYLGIPVLGLALLGAWHRRDLRVLVILGIFALILSLGRFGGLYEIFYTVVPLWSAFRFPEKLMGIVLFVIAMLAGAGLDAARAGKGRLSPWLVAAVLCAGVGLALRTEPANAWIVANFGSPPDLTRQSTDSSALAFFWSTAAALCTWLILAGARRGLVRGVMLVGALATLITLDLGRANLEIYRTGPTEAATFVPPFAEAIAAREGALAPGRFRLISIRQTKYVAPKAIYRVFGYDSDIVERRQALDLEHNAQFHLETVYAYLPSFSARLAALLKQRIDTHVAARYNVAYYIGSRGLLTDPQNAKGVVAVIPEYDLALFKNPVPAKPRAYLSRRPEPAAAPVAPAALIVRPDFLSGDVDVIEPSDLTLPGPATDGSAVIERYDAEDVRVRVETPQPAVLVLLDAYDKGWTATLESGEEIPILRANALVRAVVVPAGKHVVTFSYQTPLLKEGAWASLTGVLACIGLIAHARGRRRHPGGSA